MKSVSLVVLGLAGCGQTPAEPKPELVEKTQPQASDAKHAEMAERVAPESAKELVVRPDEEIEPMNEELANEVPETEPTWQKDAVEEKLIEPIPLPEPDNATRLSPTEEVWINREKEQVYVGGRIALRRGMLEMFACTKGTKEHESIIAVNSLAATVHTALLAVGAVPGSPVTYDPEYKPPTGTEIEVAVEWKDPQGNWKSAKGREWVRNVRTERELDVPWVFAGSGFYVDEETGKQHYMAESGDLICVSNFGSAMLDLPVESSQAEAGLLFDAFTERIPPLGTPVRLILTPKLKPQAVSADSKMEE